MLSLFPSLLFYNFQGTASLRIVLGLIVVILTIHHLRHFHRKPSLLILSLIEIITGLLLIIGLWTQAAALIVAILALGSITLNYHHRDNTTDGSQFYFYTFQLLLAVVALSLITLGPGAWALDWPL